VVKVRLQANGAPFASIEELALRAGISQGAINALADADAFADLGRDRHEASWDAMAIDPGLPTGLPLFWTALQAEHPELHPPIQEQSVSLPPTPESEAIGRDYARNGLTLRRHPLALLRPQFERVRCDDTSRARQCACKPARACPRLGADAAAADDREGSSLRDHRG
jgi:error-prone DNA polymerase